jgi:hypothetical protein
MDTLCSPYFAGRGYVEDGYKKAARFVEYEFKSIGLESVFTIGGYQQRFPMSVNTFPGNLRVGLCNAKGKKQRWLVPGQDYILDPGSDGFREGRLSLLRLDSASLMTTPSHVPVHTNRALTYDSKLRKYVPNLAWTLEKSGASAAIELTDGPLAWGASQDSLQFPLVILKKKVLKKRDQIISLEIEQQLNPYYVSSNVIGSIQSQNNPDSFIVIGAHLDHLCKMGKDAMFPGANDNASGTAMMLDIARYFTKPEVKKNLRYSIIFISFGGEEAGLIGSKYFVEHSPVDLSKIKFMINMDLMGNGQDGMMVVNGSVFKKQYDSLIAMNNRGQYLKEIKSRGKAANSDHYWFSEKGVPSFFFYLLGDYPWYHDIYDTPEKPTLKGYDGTFRLITEFVRSL